MSQAHMSAVFALIGYIAFNTIVARYVKGVPPSAMVFVYCGVVSLITGAVTLWGPQNGSFTWATKSNLTLLVLSGVIAFFADYFLMRSYSLGASTTEVMLITSAMPAMMYVLNVLIYGESISVRKICAVGLALGAVYLVASE